MVRLKLGELDDVFDPVVVDVAVFETGGVRVLSGVLVPVAVLRAETVVKGLAEELFDAAAVEVRR